jgi:gliding motility-associated-like protein
MKVLIRFFFVFWAANLWAQTDDLMIVEYIDNFTGDGFAIEILNPTSASIDLSNYWVRVFNNGSTTNSSSTRLSGNLSSKGTFIFGNNAYCGSCSCNQNGGGITGVNGNDVIALVKGSSSSTNWVDMINLYGVDVYPRVDGVNRALERKKIIRRCDNTTRYTSTDGTSPNSWPNNPSTNVTGWISLPDSCARGGFKEPDFKLKVGFDSTICSSATITLDAGSGYKTYSWNTGAKTRSISVSKAGTYFVLVDSAECKSGRDTFNIKIDTAPKYEVGFDSTICLGRSLTLDAGSFSSYLWQNSDKTQTLSANRTLNVNQSGNYIITVNKGLCSEASDTFKIQVVGPTALNVGFDSTLCDGQSLLLDAGPGFVSYNWSLEGQSDVFSQTLNTTKTGLYIITVNKGLCSEGKDSFNLVFKPIPSFSLGMDTAVCQGLDVAIRAKAGFNSYRWTKDGQLLNIASAQLGAKNFGSGLYSVTVNFGACDEFTATKKVEFKPLPARPVLRDTSFCQGESVSLDAGAGYDSYSWNSGESTRTIRVSSPGTYQVVVSLNDCEATAQAKVEEKVCVVPKFFIYNVITPNGDGQNDVFFLEDTDFFGPVKVEIFNRWGQRVFESSDYRNTWNGDNLPDGTYFYVIKPTKLNETFKGALVILK